MSVLWSKITPRICIDPLRVIEDAPICNPGVFRDLTQCVMPNISYLFYYDLVLEDLEYQQYNVLNYSRERKHLAHCQDPVIYIGVRYQQTSFI